MPKQTPANDDQYGLAWAHKNLTRLVHCPLTNNIVDRKSYLVAYHLSDKRRSLVQTSIESPGEFLDRVRSAYAYCYRLELEWRKG